VSLLHSGWVGSRMGASAPLSPEESVRCMLALMDDYEPSLTGGFFSFEGVIGAVHFV